MAVNQLPWHSKSRLLAKCEPGFSEPRIVVAKSGYTKDLPVTYGAKPMPPVLKKYTDPPKKPFIWYETEEPYFDAYMKKLERENAKLIRSYNRPKTAKGKSVKEMLKGAYKRQKIITWLDVKNEAIFRANKANAERARDRSGKKSINKTNSTEEIINYFSNN